MGIEKMAFVDIGGDVGQLDETLRVCLATEMFHPEYAAKLSEYSVGAILLSRNPFGALLVKINDIASQLGITLSHRGYEQMSGGQDEFIDSTHEYLNKLRAAYPSFFENRRRILDEMESYKTALEMLGHVDESDINFDRIWENKFLKVRFGRLPQEGLRKLEGFGDKPFEMYRLDDSERHAGEHYAWCMYFTTAEFRPDIDKMFLSVGFERLRVPDFVHGTPAEAIAYIRRSLEDERVKLEGAAAEIKKFVDDEKELFLSVYSHVQFLHDAYDLRKYAVGVRDRFHLIGFVAEGDSAAFSAMIRSVRDVTVVCSDAGKLKRLPVPVRLRNNWFTRPFEMFVDLYGSPAYHDVDPTPFLAYTYTLLFGIMFGDLGQGLCVALLGWFLLRKKKMPLGGVMTRIGLSSMFVGFWYGSVFGFEHLLDPFFTNVMGLAGKPVEVLHPDTTTKILLVAVGLGACSIVSAIIFNITIGLRRRDYDRALLSSNGLSGLVLYGSALFGAIGALSGKDVFTLPYVLALIVLPVIVIFFREPIAHYAHLVNNDTIISHDAELKSGGLLTGSETHVSALFNSPFMTARFGRIPTDSYRKLSFYANEPFMLYPVKTDQEYIWLIYAMAAPDKDEIDAIFHDLYFERFRIPEADLETEEGAVRFIRACIDRGGTPAPAGGEPPAAEKRRSLFGHIFPEGFGGFFMVTFFELFEVLLSFVSNTMSFLRVGGFVLVHAGMMSVVFTLARMVNSGGATVFIIIFGNIFVMLLEGLIVGIQVLRLEFYEMFSRFYGAGGEAFKPVTQRYSS